MSSIKGPVPMEKSHTGTRSKVSVPIDDGTEFIEDVNLGKTSDATNRRSRGFISKSLTFARKYWWLIGLGALVFIVIAVLLLIMVAIPRIAQSAVTSTKVRILSQKIGEPLPDSMHIEMLVELSTNSPFTAKIMEFPADIYHGEVKHGVSVPFGRVTIPKIISGKHVQVMVDSPLEILDFPELTTFVKTTVMNKTSTLTLYGKTKLVLAPLKPVDVIFEKTITLSGLNQVHNSNLTELRLDLFAPKNKKNIKSLINIVNPSNFTVDFGLLYADIICEGVVIGLAELPGFVVKPGHSANPLTSDIDLVKLAELITKYPSGRIPIVVTPVQSIAKTGEHIKYFEESLKYLKLDLMVILSQALGDMGGLLG